MAVENAAQPLLTVAPRKEGSDLFAGLMGVWCEDMVSEFCNMLLLRPALLPRLTLFLLAGATLAWGNAASARERALTQRIDRDRTGACWR